MDGFPILFVNVEDIFKNKSKKYNSNLYDMILITQYDLIN
jgi:hypothetical protein